MWLDPLRFAIAVVPLAAYVLLIGVVNLRQRPLLTSGAADLATVCLAISGLVFVGPIELFRPEPATTNLGDAIWLLLIGLYWLGVLLVVLAARPRLVIYNMTAEQLRPLLADAVAELDPDARWAGDSVKLPTTGVQCHLDVFGPMRHASIVSSGGQQDLDGWRRLRKALARSLTPIRVEPNPRGYSFVAAAAMLLTASIVRLANEPQQVAHAIGEILAF